MGKLLGKPFDDVVRDQQQARKWAEDNGALVQHETGKYYKVSTHKGAVHLYDSCRPISKPERSQIKFWFFCLGLPVASILIGIFVWLQ